MGAKLWVATLIGGLGLVLGAVVLFPSRRPPSAAAPMTDEDERPPTDPTVMPGQARRPPPTAATGVRQQIRKSVDEAAGAVTLETLPRYLEGLLARARAQGRITALESEVGMEMIARVGGDIETQLGFAAKLNALAGELGGSATKSPPAAPAVRNDLNRIAAELRSTNDESKRQELVRAYQQKAATLPPDEEPGALTRLNEMVAASGPRPTAPPDLASIWSALDSAQGPQRQDAIRRLQEAASRLPPEEQIEHLERLNRLTATDRPAQAGR